MILKALYDYYNRCDNLPAHGMEEKEINFLIVIDCKGDFKRIEDCRLDKKNSKKFFVSRTVGRSGANSGLYPCYFYDKCKYVIGLSTDGKDLPQGQYFDAFVNLVATIASKYPNNSQINAVHSFYTRYKTADAVKGALSSDPLFEDIKKNQNYFLSFRVDGDTKIVAEDINIIKESNHSTSQDGQTGICLVTGNKAKIARLHAKTPLPKALFGTLVSFEPKHGYDSYGKTKGFNAPVSEEAEFAYTTALNTLLRKDSRNKFFVGERTFVFWASSNNDASKQAEDALFSMLGFTANADDPNANIENVRKVFDGIYSGSIKTSLDDKFYILGLGAPNSARIAAVYWSETTLRDFAGTILRHFKDMEIIESGQYKLNYGLNKILLTTTLDKKKMDSVAPNLSDSVVKSIFQGLPYPFALYTSVIRRIRAEQKKEKKAELEKCYHQYGPIRFAIIKAYLNRLNDTNNKKLDIMLDKENTNQGYLCGRLFATLERIQEKSNNNTSERIQEKSNNNTSTIRERYMNAASATPVAVFPTLLNLSNHHSEKLNVGAKIHYEKTKQEIIDKIMPDGFPAHLDLQDQGRFFVGYYHQRQDFFTSKNENNEQE